MFNSNRFDNSKMFSRVAHSLYWMARYIERAENIARLVDVNLQLLLDLRNLDEKRLAAYWLPIVQATGDEEEFFKLHPHATGTCRHGISRVSNARIRTPLSSPFAPRAKTPAWCATSSRSNFGRN